MATLDGMVIVDSSQTRTAGAAFVLNRPAKMDGIAQFDGRWTVEVRNGSRMVLARGNPVATYEEARSQSFDAIQRFLDLYCAAGNLGLIVTGAGEEHLAWWSEADGIVLRTWNIGTLPTPTVSMTITVTDPAGSVAKQSDRPPVKWHKSMRFFRLSQATDDLLDAYRNMFLAFESILSEIVPIKRTKRQFEKEIVWLKRALSECQSKGLVQFASFAPIGTADPIAFAIKDIYTDHRTSLFHAKSTRTSILPQDTERRPKLEESFRRLSGIYLALAKSFLNSSRPSTMFYAQTIEKILDSFVDGTTLFVSDDSTLTNPSLEVFPEHSNTIALRTRPAPELAFPNHKTLLAEAKTSDLKTLSCLHIIICVLKDGTPVTFSTLEGNLTLDGIARFQAVSSLRMAESSQFKQFYDV